MKRYSRLHALFSRLHAPPWSRLIPATCFILILSACLFVFLPAFAGGTELRNLSRENREFLDRKVEELRQVELWAVSRGRWRPNPVDLSAFTIYQTMLTSREFLLKRHTDQFASSLERLRSIPSRRLPVQIGVDTAAIIGVHEKELVRCYMLENTLADSKTILEAWTGLEGLVYMMEAIPVQAELAIGARRWLEEYYGGAVPAPVDLRWGEIMQKRVTALSAPDMGRALDDISAEYSRLMLSVVKGEPR